MGGTMNAQWIRNDGRPRVVITGLGAITPHGQGVEAAWRGVVGGRSTIGPITRFDARSFPVRFAAEAPDPGLSEELPEGLSPLAQDLKGRLSVAAAGSPQSGEAAGENGKAPRSMCGFGSGPPRTFVGRSSIAIG